MALPITPPPTMATSQDWVMILRSDGEARLDQPAHARLAGEEAAGEGGLLELLAGEVDGGRGDVERVQIQPAEGDGGRARHRQLDHAIDRAVGVIADDPPAVPMAAPDPALGIDGHAVGDAIARRHAGEEMARADLAVGRDLIAV